MGKKSKAKGKGRAFAATSTPAAGSASAITAAAAGAIVGAGSGGKTKSKDPRCFKCLSFVKVSEGKGHQCPGCSETFCWKCERKDFKEIGCPNGKDCVVGKLRRCSDCANGETLARTRGIPSNNGGLCVYQDTLDLIQRNKMLSMHCIPPVCCTLKGEDCLYSECAACFYDAQTHRIATCATCKTASGCLSCFRMAPQCNQCNRVTCIECLLTAKDAGCAFLEEDYEHNPAVLSTDSAKMLELGKELQMLSPVSTFTCFGCETWICFSCASDNELRRNMTRFTFHLDNMRNGKSPEFNYGISCDRCYFTKKPCTNPTCPNEVVVPTKRCGGCHISRYCSKECQAAAYPAHQKQCAKVQLNTIARLGVEAGLFDLD